MQRKVVGAQGEVDIYEIDAIPEGIETKPVEKTARGWIISHSEQGHHHILTGGDVVECIDPKIPEGMQVFYAMLDEPEELIQDAVGDPHAPHKLDKKFYEFRTTREYDPFTQQARRVAD